MNLQETKELIQLSNDLGIDKRELFENISEQKKYFEAGCYRFYTEDTATKQVINMYKSDEYILGCFNASFIADFIPLDYDDIKALQETDKGFEILGKLILNSGKLNDFINEYIRLDGYGHALNSYDHSHEEITLNDIEYIYIRD